MLAIYANMLYSFQNFILILTEGFSTQLCYNVLILYGWFVNFVSLIIVQVMFAAIY